MTHCHPPLRDSDGQTATEYAILLALLVAVVMGAFPLFGTTVVRLFDNFSTAFGG